jgi:hypothetical protein
MKRSGIVIVIIAMLLPFGCKSNERGIDTVGEQPTPRAERGPDLGLPIRIIDTPTANWVTIDSLTTDTGKQVSIASVYVSKVSRALYKSQFGFLLEGDLPDGCSSLSSVDLVFEGDVVLIHARSRRDPNAMCTQALVPFSFFAIVSDDDSFGLVKRWKSGDTSAIID